MPSLPRMPRPRIAFVVAGVFTVLGIALLVVPDTAEGARSSIPLWLLGVALILFAVWLSYATWAELGRRRQESAGRD